MASTIQLDIVSAEKELFSGICSMITAPAAEGEVGISPGHAPMITRLKPGEVRADIVGGEEQSFYVNGGILEVQPHVVTILSDIGLRAADLDEMPCLAEEIARIYGIDNLPSTLPSYAVTLDPVPALTKVVKKCEDLLIHRGFSKVNTFPMIAQSDFDNINASVTDKTIIFQNPLSQDASILRHDLYPSLLKVLTHNSHRQHERIFIFEIGKTFQKEERC